MCAIHLSSQPAFLTSLLLSRSPGFARRYSYLYRGFTDSAYLWELVIGARKIVLRSTYIGSPCV
jgi:hypothetical protein